MNWLTYHKQLLKLVETIETLMPSQVSVQDALLRAIQTWEPYINLYGSPGTGKTFVAHVLHHRTALVYFSDPTHYDASVSRESAVVIDNAPPARQEARRLYDRIRWGQKDYTGPRNVILITRQPIDDAVRRIELTLTDTDIVHIENIIRQQFGESNFETISQYDQQRSGLWWYLKTLAQKAE
ncbi:hypothetical protein F4054_17540 [Candidatus Poribacteria bacterium]|nr:hypothetical protein [Candidatus Poribacteria bacterium]MYG05626.1 hypothetical protein [Candidatus Poribacteria bacterium]MYK24048.1 hypothetical protein [Candidatus Poribacteria bacterium]